MKDTRNTLFKVLFSLSLIIFSFSSCDVGLGSAVDTEPPELVINSPEPASIIRGSFAIKGSWTDDREVEKVFCTLKNTENEKQKFVINGKVTTEDAGKGKWNVIVDQDTVPDGPYEAAVSIVDKAGHETKVVRQLVIDNTPPVVILKRPSSRKGETSADNIDGYGQIFSLKGLAADDSGVGLIEVSIYSDEGLTQQMGETIRIKNVPNTISLDVAEFEEGIENNYSAIYGSTERTAGEQKRWCRVTAYDGSQYYPADGSEQTEADKKGNASLSYYLYEDLSSTVLNVYKITDLYAMRNGSYNSGDDSRTVANSTLAVLSNSEITAGVFTLNPANNPYYTVSGYKELKLDGTDFDESMYHKNGNSLVISIKPGLDSYELVPESLKVFVQECNNNGEPVGNLGQIELENITKEPSGNTYTITAPVNKGNGISIAKKYLLIVEGEDEKHNPVKPRGNGYGFYLDSNGVKPTLKVDEPQSTATVACNDSANSILIRGSVYFPSEACEGGRVIIKDSADSSLIWTAGEFFDERDANGNIIGTQKTDEDQEWSITLNFKKNNSGDTDGNSNKYLPDGNHTLIVYAVAGTDATAIDNNISVERNIKLDTQKPEMPVLSKVDNTVYSASKWYTSQNLGVEVEVEDKARSGYSSGLFKTEYSIGNSNIWTSLLAASHGYINGLEDGTNTIKFRSVDEVGNKSEESVYTIKADTEPPVITKAYIGVDNAANNGWKELTAGTVKNIKQSDSKKIKLEIDEAHDLPLVTVALTTAGIPGEETIEGTLSQDSVTNKWIWVSNDEAELAEDKEITISITAKDGTQINTATEAFKVLVDTQGPVIEITSPDKTLEGEESLKEYKTLRAGINDKAGNVAQTKYKLTTTPYTVEGMADEEALNNLVLGNARSETGGWTVSAGKGSVSVETNSASFTITPGKWYFYVYSKDEADNESWKVRDFWFDQDYPSLGITAASKPTSIYKKEAAQSSQIVNISGTASDSNGIAEVKYCTDYNTTTKEGTWLSTSTYNQTTHAWTISRPYGTNDINALADGNYIIAIKAIDKAGKANIETYSVLIDTVPPVISNITDDTDTTPWSTSLELDIALTATDETSKISLVQYNANYDSANPNEGWTPFTYTPAANDKTGTASGPVVFEESGIKTLYIKATDKAGNETVEHFNKKIDADKPSLTAKYTQIEGGSIGNFGGTAYENGSAAMTFWGEYSDSVSGVDTLSIKLGEQNLTGTGVEIKYSTAELPASKDEAMPSSYDDYANFTDKTAIKSWKAVIQGSRLGTGTVTIHGSDIAGNTNTAQQTTNLVHDELPPVINSSTIIVKDNSDTTKAFLKSAQTAEILEYYVNNSNGKTFTISGSSIDENGVSVTKIKLGEGAEAHTAYANTKTAGSWSFTVNDLHTFTGESVTATITTTDLAGNTCDKKLKLIFDTNPPAKSGAIKIGGKDYSSGMWGTSLVLTMEGGLTDDISGPSKVYYKRSEASPSTEERQNFISHYRTVSDGSITASDTGFSGSITNLSEGNNYLLLMAEDKVGNPVLVDSDPYYVQIDTKAPSLEAANDGARFTNGTTPVTVTGTCSDVGSGLASVKVSVTIGSGENALREVVATKVNGTDWAGGWTATITEDKLTGIVDGGTYNIEATATDIAGHSTTIPVTNLKGDTHAPEAELNSVTPSVAATTEGSCYIRPDQALTVKGLSKDTYSTTVYTWLKLIPYTENGTAGTAQEIFEATDTNHLGTTLKSWTLTVPAGTLSTSGYTKAKLFACTKDLAGNTAEIELYTLMYDVKGPEYSLTGSGSSFVATTIDGKEYSPFSWYNNINLIITGTWKDLAGVTEVYYEIVEPDQTATIDKSNAASYSSFTVSNKENGFYAFNSEIRGFKAGINHLVMYAKDALGNVSDVGKELTVQVDTNPPTGTENTPDSFNTITLTNGKNDNNLTMDFYASDAESGLDFDTRPVVKLGTEIPSEGTNAEYAATETAGKGYLVTVTLNEQIFENKQNYIPIIVAINDKSGNTKEVNIGTINVDSEKPVVKLNAPKDADVTTPGIQVNKTISITGTANDKNLEERFIEKVQYKTENGNWTDLYEDYTTSNTNITYNGTTDFTVKVDTTQFTDGQKYYIRTVVADKAGNMGWSTDNDTAPIEFTVVQDTDRPIITFMDIALPADFDNSKPVTLKLTSKKFRLTVSDDDGVSEFKVIVNNTELYTQNVKNGTWIYDLTQTDGTYDIKFEVTDTGIPTGTTFKSGNAVAPKFTGSENSINDASISFKLMIDTTSPVSKKTEYAYYSGTDLPAEPNWNEAVPALGGKRTKLALRINAGDENKIAGITAKLDDTVIASDKVSALKNGDEIIHSGNTEDATDLKWYSTWIIKNIDVSAAGEHKLELSIKDGADNTRTAIVTLSVDIKPPELNITNPIPTANSNTFSSGSIQAYGGITGATKLYYALSPDGENAPDGTAVSSWIAKDGTSGSCSGATLNPSYSDEIEFSAKWSINFDGDLSATTGIHDFLLNDYLIKYGITTQAKLESDDESVMFKNPVCLYLWLKAEDEVGNEIESPFEIVVNPQGDRPTVDFSYPDNGVLLGKAVSIYGTHQDTLGNSTANIGVKSVWIQLISKAHGEASSINLANRLEYSDTNEITKFSMTADDLNYMATNGYEVYNMKTYNPSGTNAKWANGSTIPEGYTPNDYAALANISGAAWNITINSKNELDPNDDSEEGQNPVGIRVFAKDGDGKTNTIKAERLVFFDNDTPLIENLQLVQYDGSDNEIAVRKYVPDMYISSKNGSWKLKGRAWDKDEIKQLIFTINDEAIHTFDISAAAAAGHKNYFDFEYELNTGTDNSVGTISFVIEATDDAVHTGKENISIRFDNKKPELITSGSDYNIATIIRQSDGFYKFGSKAKEDPVAVGGVTTTQSGFAYTAFYFMRGTKLYDILKAKNNAELSGNATTDNTSSYHYEDNIYWYTKTLTERTEAIDTLTVAASDSTGVSGIHKNSLVKIGGAFYKVIEVNENAKTFKIDGIPPKEETTAYIAVASLIDNTSQEKVSEREASAPAPVKEDDGYYKADDLDFDDGDRMLESVYKSGTTWEWSANVCSKNISDGPVKLVYVVFDGAGNYEAKSVDCIIGNYTPRLAGFTLYTDYNNDGIVDSAKDGKYEAYVSTTYGKESVTGTIGSGANTKQVYDPDAKNSIQEKKPLGNKITVGPDENGKPVMTLRGKTVIIPEIVGGNKKVYYEYSINGHNGKNETELFTTADDYTIKSKEINIQLGDLVSFGDTQGTEFKFTFFDEIDARNDLLSNENFTAAQKEEINAYLSVYLGIAASANNVPQVKINPFHWNSLKDNSIYGTGEATARYNDLQGHIELEEDWKNSDYYTNLETKPTAGEYDADPKISGKVVVTGTAHDDNLIKEIKVKFGSFIDTTVVQFNNTNGKLTPTANASGTGYEFIIKENGEKFTEKGHDVEWILNLYTDELAVSLDNELTVTAINFGKPDIDKITDNTNGTLVSIDGETKYKVITANDYKTGTQKENPTNSGQTTTAAKTAYYRMDIVPYITGVTTKLSSYSSAEPSIYSRSALGRYSVYSTRKKGNGTPVNEKISISGFNLTGGTVNFAGTAGNTQSMGTKIEIPSGAKSGEVSVVVSEVTSLNNLNNNNSHGSYVTEGSVGVQGNYAIYSNYYNRIPNNKNNNNLTDDVYLNIWDFNSEAALADSNTKVDNLEMKINPLNGLIGFAFSNGSTRFSMPKKDTSYNKWNRSFDYMKYNALAYDTSGNSYAVSVGGDINGSGGYDFFSFMSSRWGAVGGDAQADNKTGGNHLNLDAISSVEGDKNTRTRSKDRFQSQSIATHGSNIYLAYYDQMYSQIRFKAGVFPSNNAVGAFDNFRQRKKNEGSGDYATVKDDAPYCQIIADGTNSTFGVAGEYVSIGVMPYSYKVHETDETPVSGDIVAIVWYDGNNLQFAYGVDPLGNVANDGKATDNKIKNGDAGWVGTTQLISGGGEYCQLVVANDNSIHIAAYNSSKSDLEYIYIPFDTENHLPNVSARIKCSVDTYLDIGEQLTIDVAEVNGKQIPYIGYRGAYPELPRYAYLENSAKFYAATNAVTNGAVNNCYTGIWECMVVPSQSNVKDSRKISVGVWKYNGTEADDGRLAYSTTGEKRGQVDGDNSYSSSTASATEGYCYGNSSNNGVLAYVVSPTGSQYCAETAQMR